MSILEKIHCHEDLVKLTEAESVQLCSEIRQFLVSHVSQTGGHLASNLGALELSVAIETVYNTMKDRLVFDVGHQSYVHKLLTGRQADFSCLRQFGGMSGFPKPSESDSDAFVAGHASSSVSIALGMARARTLLKQDYDVVALLGDGAATGGMVYEGLNDAAVSREPMVIILNDNEMSIDRNVGGMSRHLSLLRTKERYLGMKKRYRRVLRKLPGGKTIYRITKNMKDRLKRMLLPSTLFENMGLTYLGPVDGHDLPGLIALLKTARDLKEPVLVHVLTRKGCGYLPAEEDPSKFHGIGKFDPKSGCLLSPKSQSFSGVFGETLMQIAGEDSRVCAITAAMPSGTGLLDFKKKYPKRLFDVGIAEEHAVSMAGGLAKQGMIPVVAIYSTFLQRSYDQIMQDVGLLGLHVVFAVDRAGLVGEDGPTHHGVFDIGFLRQVPGMTILSPANYSELRQALRWAVLECTGPVAVRYPRGGEVNVNESLLQPDNISVHGVQSDEVTLISYGTISAQMEEAARILRQDGIGCTDVRLLSPTHFDRNLLLSAIRGKHVFVIEETASGAGISGEIALAISRQGGGLCVHSLDLGTEFVPHGSIPSLYQLRGLDAASIANHVREVLRHEK